MVETWLKPTSPSLEMFFLMESLENLVGRATLPKGDALRTILPFGTHWYFYSCNSHCLNILILWLRIDVISLKKHFLTLFNLGLISHSLLPPSRLDDLLCVPLHPVNQRLSQIFWLSVSLPSVLPSCPAADWLTAGDYVYFSFVSLVPHIVPHSKLFPFLVNIFLSYGLFKLI